MNIKSLAITAQLYADCARDLSDTTDALEAERKAHGETKEALSKALGARPEQTDTTVPPAGKPLRNKK